MAHIHSSSQFLEIRDADIASFAEVRERSDDVTDRIFRFKQESNHSKISEPTHRKSFIVTGNSPYKIFQQFVSDLLAFWLLTKLHHQFLTGFGRTGKLFLKASERPWGPLGDCHGNASR